MPSTMNMEPSFTMGPMPTAGSIESFTRSKIVGACTP